MGLLFKEIMRSSAPVLKYHQEFWGEYERFNNISAPSSEEIANYQLKKLSSFQMNAFKESGTVQHINKFLCLNGGLPKSMKQYDQLVYTSLQNIFNEINQLIASGYMSAKKRSNLKEYEQDIANKLQALGKALNNLRNQGNMILDSKYIHQLDSVISALPNGDIDAVLKTLYHLKGDILEEVGVNWFNERIPTELKAKTKAYSTGSIFSQKGQLISDLLIVDLGNVDLMNTEITYKVNGYPYSASLKDFFQTLEKNKGQKTIVIGTEGEQLLQEVSLLGVQAKSGVNQLPWNQSKNTWVSIRGEGQPLDNYLDFLDHINKLKKSWDNKSKNIKQDSKVYRAMADYELANSLSKVLHLSQQENQYVLTPNGFMPYTSRILELYEKKGSQKYYFTFGKRILLNGADDFLTVARPVIMKM